MCDTHGPEMVHIRHSESGGETLVPAAAVAMYGPGWEIFEPLVPLAPPSPEPPAAAMKAPADVPTPQPKTKKAKED